MVADEKEIIMIRSVTIPALLAALLAACSPPVDAEAELAAEQATAEASPQSTPSGQPAPDVFAATAWRATAEDGARFTTYLDPDGTYRDFRNGDPWQEGSWDHADAEGGRVLCFTPDAENALERCWEPGRMRGDTMEASGDNGTRIELERVEYVPNADPETAE